MKESTLTAALAKLIRDRGGVARKIHGGIYGAGLPDIVGVHRGYPLYLEVKLPGKEKNLTKLQAEVLANAKAAGAIARVVTSRDDVRKILDAIDRKRDGTPT